MKSTVWSIGPPSHGHTGMEDSVTHTRFTSTDKGHVCTVEVVRDAVAEDKDGGGTVLLGLDKCVTVLIAKGNFFFK